MRAKHSLTVDGRIEQVSARAIARWRVVLVACIGVVALGVLAWKELPQLEDPRVDTNAVVVTIPYPGASADDVEAQVLKVVEPSLFQLDHLESIDSQARTNTAFLELTFDSQVSLDAIVERVSGKLRAKREELPREVQEPDVQRVTTASVPAMVLAVVGNRSDGVLTDAANRARDQISGVQGVSGITLRGASTHVVRVRLDPMRLARSGLTAQDVDRQLRLANVRAPAGEVRVGALGTLLELGDTFETPDAIRSVPVASHVDPTSGSRTVVLGDVADVTSSERVTERFIFDGIPAVGLEVRFRSDANAVNVGKSVRARLTALQASLPEETTLRIAHDEPASISDSVGKLLESLVAGIVLVIVVSAFGLGPRAAIVVAGVLPLSLAGALVGLLATGVSLDQISIAGLIIALGLLVDDAIVVAESIQVMRERGLGAAQAAVLGTARVFWANNATTTVACTSFAPLLFMGGTIGLFVRGMPAATIFALTASLIVAQLVTPLASVLLSPRGSTPPSSAAFDAYDDAARGAADETNGAFRLLKAGYARCIGVVLRRPLWVTLGFAVGLAAALTVAPRIGVQFFPKNEKPVLFVRLDMTRGSHLDASASRVKAALARVRADREVFDTSAVLGGGYPRIFAGRVPADAGTDMADVYVRARRGVDVERLASRLRASLNRMSGVRASVEELYYGPPVAHPVSIRITGESYARLRDYADMVEQRLAAIPGAINVSQTMRASLPLTRVLVDAVSAARVGLTPGQVATQLRALLGEDAVTWYGANTTKMTVILGNGTPGDSVQGLGQTRIATPSGSVIPLEAVAAIQLSYSPIELRHRNGQREVEIDADVQQGTLASSVNADLARDLKDVKWTPGYSWSSGGEYAETEKSFRSLGVATTVAVALVGLQILLMFDSFAFAAAILLALPFAMIGAVLALLTVGIPLGFMSFLGLAALVGVSVNHKIYFLDRARELVRRGYALNAALAQAGNDRIRPVILTALTAVLGLVPLTVDGGPMWVSFGWVNIFGILASIPISLVLLPALVKLVVVHPDKALLGENGSNRRVATSGSLSFNAGERD